MKKKQFIINLSYYILGFFTVGFGVNLMDKSKIGLGAWDTVTFNLHAFCVHVLGFDPDVFLIGYFSAFISFIIMIAVLLYRRKWKYLILLIPVLLMANVINFWYYLIFENVELSTFTLRMIFFVVGTLLLPFGLALIVKSSFPAFVFDEWTFMMSELLNIKSFGKTRLIIEITGVTIGGIFGYLTYFDEFGHFGSVSIGTCVVAVIFGPLMQFYMNILKVNQGDTDEPDIKDVFKNAFSIIKREFKISRVLKYILGMVFIALGVVFTLRSDLGNSTWDTLHYALSNFLGITMGWATVVVACTIILIVMIMNKSIKYIFMAVPVFCVGPLIDLFNLHVFASFEPNTIWLQIASFILGLTLLPLGGSLLIVSTYPAGVFDELMFSISRLTNTKDIVKVRVIMEVSAVSLAFIIGLIAGIGRGKIYIGTLIFAFSMGPIIKLILKGLERIGLSENQQND